MRSSAVKGGRPLQEVAGDPCSAGKAIKDVTVMRPAGTGVLIDSSVATKLSGITQNSFGRAGTYGMRLENNASATVSGSRFEGNDSGLHTALGTSATVTNCGFRENTYGVYANMGSFVTATNSIISTNTADGAHINGGTHSFQGREIRGNGDSGIHVASSYATVTVNASNLFNNGFPSGRVNLDVDIFLSPLPLISANGDFWGVLGPRDDETATANITNVQYSPRPVTNSLYGVPVLSPYVLSHSFIDNGHMNYKINTEWKEYVYAATSVWNGYRPGVIREGIEGEDALIIPIKDYPNEDPNRGLAWRSVSTYEVGINPPYILGEGYPPPAIVKIIAHELGHCLGMGDRYDNASENDLMYGYASKKFTPLTKNDTASYDAAYKLQ